MASHSIPLPILDDLGSRFIINIPDEERKDIIRIMFQVELAKWFYDDEYVNTDASLSSCSMRDFCEHIFRRVPFLTPYVDSLDEVLDDWKSYKMAVRPNCLAIRNWNSFFMVMPFVRDMRIWIKHYKRNKFEFIPGYREPEQDHHFLPVQNQAQGRRNSTKKRKNSKSQSQEQSQPQPQVGGGGRQRKQSTQAQDAPPPPPVPLETFQCPKYWSNFHFKKKDILASVAAAPGWK